VQALTWIALAGLALATYALVCRIWPYGNCRRCQGTGQLYAPFGAVYRLCPRCAATGRRLRPGRRLTRGWQALDPN
jgi:hypothetical protein